MSEIRPVITFYIIITIIPISEISRNSPMRWYNPYITMKIIYNPVIYNLGLQFRIVTNIHSANITKDSGWMIIELEGVEEDIEQGIAWVTGKGVKVEPANDFVEG